jgi:transaldolase
VNVTAVLTLDQVREAAEALAGGEPAYVSVFAGRIADTGRDPVPIVRESVAHLAALAPAAEVIWASPREVLNVCQADEAGCHVITLTMDLLKKIPVIGRDLSALSLDTVRMFRDDAVKAAFTL